MKIDETLAAAVFRKEASYTSSRRIEQDWIQKVEELSRLCEEGVSKTHIAFLGTVMLAKGVNHRADLFAIKPEHAKENPNAFSARILAENVLVPLAAEIGISLGVTGRQPLNNQPYFRMTRLDDGTPIHRGSRPAFEYMIRLVRELQEMTDEAPARVALRAFIAVRRRYQPRYTHPEGEVEISPDGLARAIRRLVQERSESGRRAQAVVAGLMDLFAGTERVDSGRINDPSRKHPGDVCVRSIIDATVIEKAIEVRDKPVSVSDVQIFSKKCMEMGVWEAAMVMVSDRQELLDAAALTKWATEFGLGLTLFHEWDDFVEQALFWSNMPKPAGASLAVGLIHLRLISVEASPATVSLWQSLTRE